MKQFKKLMKTNYIFNKIKLFDLIWVKEVEQTNN